MGICLIVKSGGGTDTSNANVTADKILSGYTVYSNDNKITGTMKNIGNQNKVDTKWGTTDSDYYKTWCGVTNWIWEGWHDGTSGFNVGTLAEHTWDCDIPDTSWCLSGYTYWRNGTKYTGVMSIQGKKEWKLGANGSQTINNGWHDGSGTVSQSIPVDTGEWGPNPTTTNQQLCWQGWYYSKNRWCWGNGNLVASNIKAGVNIFGVSGTCSAIVWIVQNGALVNGVGVEYTYQYNPNEGSSSYKHDANVSPVTKKINNSTYICTEYVPGGGNDRAYYYWYFSNIGGRLFNYTGSSTSNWKIPSCHIDWAANGLGSRKLGVYYCIGGGSGFSKIKNDAIWTWYSETTSGSINVTSVDSTVSGKPFYTGWSGAELKTGTILVAIAPSNSDYSSRFYIRNLWFDATTWI